MRQPLVIVPRSAVGLITLVMIFSLGVGVFLISQRLWFHSLSRFPGPRLWAVSRVPYVVSLLRGTFNQDLSEQHEKYGPVVRVAPNELSFACEQAWLDIYGYRPGHKEAPKDPQWYTAPNDMPQNIVTTADINVRARMRRLLSPSFNDQSVSEQSVVLQDFADILIDRLGAIHDAHRTKGEPASLNMLDWMNFYTIDVIGDLALGESFHCLDGSDYHPWVRTLYNFFKGMIVASAARYFTITEFAFRKAIPKEIWEKQKEHTTFTNTKVLQRLELSTQRPDFLTPFLKHMEKSAEKMSLGEIQSTFAILLVAGSESVATSLCGTLYQLSRNLQTQRTLQRILAKTFATEDDITVASTSQVAYLDACINEAMRLCYAVPDGLPRLAPPGGDIYAGYFVPGGTSISIRPGVLFTSDKYFTKAKEYHPERWTEIGKAESPFVNDTLSACQPFGFGSTSCIGKSLAWAEMRLVIARLLWKYNISETPDRPFRWEDQYRTIVVEKQPLWLTITPRVR